MSNTNTAKNEQLGMPFGTASQRLRKMILFKLVQKTGEDTCFKCKKRIETIDELSIEHKEPWFNKNVDLFWDLNNIAFSHLKCNLPHKHGGYKLRKLSPEGMGWCGKCKDHLPTDEFFKNKRNWNDLSSWCKKHHLELTNARKKATRAKV